MGTLGILLNLINEWHFWCKKINLKYLLQNVGNLSRPQCVILGPCIVRESIIDASWWMSVSYQPCQSKWFLSEAWPPRLKLSIRIIMNIITDARLLQNHTKSSSPWCLALRWWGLWAGGTSPKLDAGSTLQRVLCMDLWCYYFFLVMLLDGVWLSVLRTSSTYSWYTNW